VTWEGARFNRDPGALLERLLPLAQKGQALAVPFEALLELDLDFCVAIGWCSGPGSGKIGWCCGRSRSGLGACGCWRSRVDRSVLERWSAHAGLAWWIMALET